MFRPPLCYMFENQLVDADLISIWEHIETTEKDNKRPLSGTLQFGKDDHKHHFSEVSLF